MRFFFAIIGIALVFSTSGLTQTVGDEVKVIVSGLNIRANTPDPSGRLAKPIGSAKMGDRLKVLGRSTGQWIKVRHQGGLAGIGEASPRQEHLCHHGYHYQPHRRQLGLSR